MKDPTDQYDLYLILKRSLLLDCQSIQSFAFSNYCCTHSDHAATSFAEGIRNAPTTAIDLRYDVPDCRAVSIQPVGSFEII